MGAATPGRDHSQVAWAATGRAGGWTGERRGGGQATAGGGRGRRADEGPGTEGKPRREPATGPGCGEAGAEGTREAGQWRVQSQG